MTSIREHPDLLNHINISRKFGYIYVDTPKVACSTVKETLQNAERGYRLDDDGAFDNAVGYSKRLLQIHDRKISPLRKPRNAWGLRRALASAKLTFCFVRNPFSRVLSAYLDKIKANKTRRSIFLGAFGAGYSPSDEISFIEFLELIATQKPFEANAHWRCQCYHNMFDAVTYDFVGAFERFEDDFRTVLLVAAPQALEFFSTVDEHRINASGAIDRYYRDPLAASLVRQIYAGDFELFGYPTELSEVGTPPRLNGFIKS